MYDMFWCCPTATPPRRSPKRWPSASAVTEEPQLVRDALAGEDDAEDAQWLVVVEDPTGVHDPAKLDALADEYEGWLEAE